MAPRKKTPKSSVEKGIDTELQHKELVNSMSDAGFSFVGSNLNFGNDVRIDLHTMYRISKTNKMA